MGKLKFNTERDLEELEQYGFKRRYKNCYEYLREIDGRTVYRVYTTKNNGYIQIETLVPVIIESSLQCLLYDLIKAGLVEKE